MLRRTKLFLRLQLVKLTPTVYEVRLIERKLQDVRVQYVRHASACRRGWKRSRTDITRNVAQWESTTS